MTQLTDDERKAANKLTIEYDRTRQAHAFLDGFAAGLDHNQAKLEALIKLYNVIIAFRDMSPDETQIEHLDNIYDALEYLEAILPIQPKNSQNADKNLAKNETVEVTK